jgi:hypothetical protein
MQCLKLQSSALLSIGISGITTLPVRRFNAGQVCRSSSALRPAR